MTEDKKTAKIALFIDDLIRELDIVRRSELHCLHFVMFGQTVEVLGNFLDSKPLKSTDQSARRFSAAVNYLLGGRYRILNEKRYLYDKLRNQLIHTFMPGHDLILLNRKNNKAGYQHLEMIDRKLVLISEDFFEDLTAAAQRLLLLLQMGKIKPKNIAFGDEE